MNKFLKQALPHLLVVIFFVLISSIYFSPSVYNGKTLQQGDMQKFEGMSKELTEYHKNGGESAWTGAMFSGMPSYHISVYGVAPNFLSYITKVINSIDFLGASMVLTGLLAFYLLMCVMGIKRWLAVLGSIAFAFASYNFIIIVAGHITKAYTIAVMPVTLAGLVMLYKRDILLGGILFTLGVAISIMSGHIQITYYLALFLIFIYSGYAYILIKEKDYKWLSKVTGILVIGSIAAVMSNLGGLYSNYETSQTSMRGPSELTQNSSGSESNKSGGLDWDYATMWSYGRSELLTVLIPNIYGGESGGKIKSNSDFAKDLKSKGVNQTRTNAYWGDQTFTSGPVYFGALVCFLFLLGMIVIDNKMKWWFLAGAIFLTIMALGRNMVFINSVLFNYMPMYHKFRAPSMALVIPGMVFPIIAMWGLNNIITGQVDNNRLKKALIWSVSILGGLCFILWVIPGMFFDFQSSSDYMQKLPQWYMDNLVQYRKELMQSDAFRSLVFILLGSGLILIFIRQKNEGKLKWGKIIGIAMTILVLVDLWTIDKRYLNDENFQKQTLQQIYRPSFADNFILKDKSISYRVLNLNNTWQETHTSYFHKSIGGYHAAKLRRYQELINYRLSSEVQYIQESKTTEDILNRLKGCNSLNMLNAKYIVYDPNATPITNPYAMGNVWFVSDFKLVASADEEIEALNKIDPLKTAVVDKRFEDQLKSFVPSEDPSANIQLISYNPNELIYESRSKKDQIAVFSEVYYQPGWKAYVDGKKVSHFRTNWILRGMVIPAGIHKIEFKFIPDKFYVTSNIASISSAIILLLLLIAIVYSIVKEVNKIKESYK